MSPDRIIHHPSSFINSKSRFIVLDGPDGCGKSSQARMLMDWVQSQGIPAVGFRDPGATVIGEKIREILLSPAHEAMTTPAEVLLYMAARAALGGPIISRSVRKRASFGLLDKVEYHLYAHMSRFDGMIPQFEENLSVEARNE